MIGTIISIIGSLVLLLLLYVIYEFVIKLNMTVGKFKKMDPTIKIFTSPFTGLLGVQKNCIQKYGDSHRFVKDMVKQNPDQLAFLTNIGNKPFLILCDPQLIKQMSLSQKKFQKFNIFKHSDKCFSKGIFFVQNDQWSKQRSIISHSFNHQQLKKMIPVMTSCIKNYIQVINQQLQSKQIGSKKRIFKVLQENQLIIGDILVRSFFSQDAANKTIKGKSLTLALADVTANMFKRSRTALNLLTNLFFGQKAKKMNFVKKDKQLQQLVESIRQVCTQIIQERIKNYDDSLEEDFLNHYIKQMKKLDKIIDQAQQQQKQHKYKRVTKQEIIHQLVTFYFAGIDTTGHLAAMAFFALAEYPDIKAKVKQEINKVIPSPDDITYQKLQQLQYVGKFLDECLRMWPPAVGVLNRVTIQQTTIGPYKLPKDMNIGTNIIGLMYNQKFYINPQKFDPERWNDKSLVTAEPYAFIPFSAGPRSCIGKYLALMQSKMILIHFLNSFEIKRTQVPLRLYAKLLYEPIQEDLVYLTPLDNKQNN